ncbi:MAG: hypothetical protein AVDCRST_MAG18-2376 [uncultured Thermomicrobiales bacterium]|uniref:Uncharacterized protein n=1 Tax=uncultured Thermomicrobiales bacterium TaxID=1645740 RepID=A0A6J4VDS2_9BACT|nr:MAG: hypothetical protein AVDCRST_MAG18-2376 [uncultured Thermomicrobiales bacterium]
MTTPLLVAEVPCFGVARELQESFFCQGPFLNKDNLLDEIPTIDRCLDFRQSGPFCEWVFEQLIDPLPCCLCYLSHHASPGMLMVPMSLAW